ncbi:hypothetical protein SSX86_014184 [Deinandra increscens subsp. villosa]|uniref:Uncharacterized protein n=1 Tax=Deinandra increscens subsp. villosa TaxID=3103831 RepID=A0AAP0D324_9ASTR
MVVTGRTDVESTSISHVDSVQQLTCILNTEDLEIPCNDNILLLVHPSPSVIPQIATDSIDASSSFTQSQLDGPDLYSEFDSINPHAGYTLKSVSMDCSPSISDHNNSDSDSDLHHVPDTEDPEIRCIDGIFLRSPPSPFVRPQTDTDSIDLASSFTQSQMDGPDLSSEFDSASPQVGNNLKIVSTDCDHSISDHSNPDSDSNLPCFPDIENPEIPCNDKRFLLIHPSPSVRTQIATDSIDPAPSFTQLQMDGPDLSSEFDSVSPDVGNNLKNVSTDCDHSISDLTDHSNPDSDSDLPCLPDIENPEIPCNGNRLLLIHPSPSVTDSIDPAPSFTQLQMDDPDLSFEFDSAHPHAGNTLKSVSMDHNPSISDHNNSDYENDIPCFPDIEALILKLDSEFAQESWITNEVKRHKYKHSKWTINRAEQPLQRAMSSLLIHPSPSARTQIVTDSNDPASSLTQLQMDDPDLSFEFDSAHPHAGDTLKSVSMDHNPSISDHNNSDCENDLPCFPDIEALILKLDDDFAQESWITNEVKRHKYEHSKWTRNRPEQSLHRAMSSLGAFAVFSSGHFNYYIKKTEVTIGRSTDENTEVDIDLRKQSHANMISRQQIRGMNFMFEVNDRYVRQYLDNIIKKTQGEFTTFDWSVSCG